MLYNFPRRYDDYTQLKPIQRLAYGEEVTVIGTVDSVSTRPIRGGRYQITEAIITDGTGSLRVTWFNQPWIGKRLLEGAQIVLSGKIDQYLGRLVMNSPEWEPLEQTKPAHQSHRSGLPAHLQYHPALVASPDVRCGHLLGTPGC